jgi:hypothetical protein
MASSQHFQLHNDTEVISHDVVYPARSSPSTGRNNFTNVCQSKYVRCYTSSHILYWVGSLSMNRLSADGFTAIREIRRSMKFRSQINCTVCKHNSRELELESERCGGHQDRVMGKGTSRYLVFWALHVSTVTVTPMSSRIRNIMNYEIKSLIKTRKKSGLPTNGQHSQGDSITKHPR